MAETMEWQNLICDKRLGMEEYHDPRKHTRSDFQRDYDRLIFSSPFRRLQNKTQVFPLPGSIFVHNRLTHSLEVSSVGRSMAHEVALGLRNKYGDRDLASRFDDFRDIVAASCLCHDLGNPPFGHSGEKTISTFFSEGRGQRFESLLSKEEWDDFINFEGNANSFRLLTHQFAGRRQGGMAMTYSTLASIVKYPYASSYAGKIGKEGKFGFFRSEEDIFRKVAEELGIPEVEPGRFVRHPLVFITEAADDICYQIMDIEDAHKLKILPGEEVRRLLLGFLGPEDRARAERSMSRLTDPNEKVGYLRSIAINALVKSCADAFLANEEAILAGEFCGPLLNHAAPLLRDAYKDCSKVAYAHIYNAPDVVDIELAGHRIITSLLDSLTEAVMNPEKNYSRLLLSIVPGQYDTRAATPYERLQSVLDHVSGMTDVYALDLYRKLNGNSLPAV